MIAKGRFPVAVLQLTIPGNEIDVNVHPAKTEVKINGFAQLKTKIVEVLKDALWEANITKNLSASFPVFLPLSSVEQPLFAALFSLWAAAPMQTGYPVWPFAAAALFSLQGAPAASDRAFPVQRQRCSPHPLLSHWDKTPPQWFALYVPLCGTLCGSLAGAGGNYPQQPGTGSIFCQRQIGEECRGHGRYRFRQESIFGNVGLPQGILQHFDD